MTKIALNRVVYRAMALTKKIFFENIYVTSLFVCYWQNRKQRFVRRSGQSGPIEILDDLASTLFQNLHTG